MRATAWRVRIARRFDFSSMSETAHKYSRATLCCAWRMRGGTSEVWALPNRTVSRIEEKSNGDAGNRTRVEEKGHSRPTCVARVILPMYAQHVSTETYTGPVLISVAAATGSASDTYITVI